MKKAAGAISRYQVACLILLSAALLFISLGGGMLYDRVSPNPELSGPLSLIGFPLAAMLTIFALAIALWFDRASWRPRAMSIGAGGLVVWTALSVFGSPHPHASLIVFTILASAAALGWAVVAARLPRSALLGLAMALVTAASVVGGLGISEYLAHISQPPRDFSWRVFSTFATPNFLAGYLVMTIPLTAACLLAAREQMVRLLCGMGLAIQAACLLLTGSRFGLASLAVALVALAVLLVRGGLVKGFGGRRGRTAGAVIIAVALLGAVPVTLRLLRSGAESHSSQFRIYTWRGAAKMAAANPALGTGIGTFDVAHAPYAEVAFTQHAHNSYLQLAGESGLPAIALFLLAVGVALMSTFRSARATGSEDAGGGTGLQGGNGAALLAAGAGAGILGGLARNLFDSDLYVPANAFVLAAMCGLGLAAAATSSDTPVGRGNLHRVFAVLVLLLFLQFVPRYALARFWARNGEAALLQRDGRGMEAGYKFAAMTDSLNQEYMLKLAGIYVAAGNASEAESAFREAIRRAKTGKAYYQYARFLSQHKRIEDAINAHQKARELDPHNLQNLLALAETYATEARVEDAERVYRRVAELYDSPVGQVRAVPELIEYEFGEAYRALGEIAMKGGDTDGAESNLRQAVSILGEYWARRKNPMVQIQVRPEKALLVGDKYRQALSSLGNVLKARGRASEAAEIDSRSSTLLAEIERDKEEAAESDR